MQIQDNFSLGLTNNTAGRTLNTHTLYTCTVDRSVPVSTGSRVLLQTADDVADRIGVDFRTMQNN